jgi:uncharacterized membrane protein
MAATTQAGKSGGRVESIDILRGVVMILMALDHVRDYFGVAGNPTDLATASTPLFFARWITHICAPTFFLLTGVGAFLMGQKKTVPDLSRFLLVRGVWLLVLELTVLRWFGYQFNFDYRVTFLIVIWALGWAMILLAGLVRLGPGAALAVGVAMIAGHNLFDGVSLASVGAFAPFWNVLHAPSILISVEDHVVFVAYPLIPWVGVTAAGYGLGQVFAWAPDERRRFLLRAGMALTLGFVALRWINVYGDPVRWTANETGVLTLLSFLNATKRPPSLLYLLMTLGPALVMLSLLELRVPRWLRPAVVFGRVPLFYFALHFTTIHLVAVVVCYALYGEAHWMFESPTLGDYPYTRPPGWGFSLPVVYFVWVAIVAALFPVSRWFADVKRRSGAAWVSYV